jgi:peptide/nickel transport system permease protein
LRLKGAIGAVILIGVVSATLLGDYFSPVDAGYQVLSYRLRPLGATTPDGITHPFGTDALGRDLLARTLVGARVSLLVAVVGVLLAGTLGVSMGLLSGYFGGRVDHFIMTLADTQLALPFTLVAISMGALTGPSLGNLLLVLAVTGWVSYARLVRSQVLSLRETDFVLAARSLGCGNGRIILRHVLPNCASPIIIISSFATAQMIVAEATVSFLGVGVPSWIPSWGTMISEGRNYLAVAWWVVMVPGAAITLTVIAINLLGDWLRDRLDPRLKAT